MAFPIILDEGGGVMDGMHRVCKAAQLGINQILAVQFRTNPEPDYIDCDPQEPRTARQAIMAVLNCRRGARVISSGHNK